MPDGCDCGTGNQAQIAIVALVNPVAQEARIAKPPSRQHKVDSQVDLVFPWDPRGFSGVQETEVRTSLFCVSNPSPLLEAGTPRVHGRARNRGADTFVLLVSNPTPLLETGKALREYMDITRSRGQRLPTAAPRPLDRLVLLPLER